MGLHLALMGVFALLDPGAKAQVALGGKRGGALHAARLDRNLIDGGWITDNVVGPFMSVPGSAGW